MSGVSTLMDHLRELNTLRARMDEPPESSDVAKANLDARIEQCKNDIKAENERSRS